MTVFGHVTSEQNRKPFDFYPSWLDPIFHLFSLAPNRLRLTWAAIGAQHLFALLGLIVIFRQRKLYLLHRTCVCIGWNYESRYPLSPLAHGSDALHRVYAVTKLEITTDQLWITCGVETEI